MPGDKTWLRQISKPFLTLIDSRMNMEQHHKYLDISALVRFPDTDGTRLCTSDESSAELIYRGEEQITWVHTPQTYQHAYAVKSHVHFLSN